MQPHETALLMFHCKIQYPLFLNNYLMKNVWIQCPLPSYPLIHHLMSVLNCPTHTSESLSLSFVFAIIVFICLRTLTNLTPKVELITISFHFFVNSIHLTKTHTCHVCTMYSPCLASQCDNTKREVLQKNINISFALFDGNVLNLIGNYLHMLSSFLLFCRILWCGFHVGLSILVSLFTRCELMKILIDWRTCARQ